MALKPFRSNLPTPSTLSSRLKERIRSAAPRDPVRGNQEDQWGVWMSVSSSNVEAARYNEHQMTLQVRFRGGSVYEYVSVPLSVFDAMLSSDSKGRFVHRVLKGKYTARRATG